MNLDIPRASLLEAVRSAWFPPGSPTPAPAVPEATVRALVAEKFADRAWIERF